MQSPVVTTNLGDLSPFELKDLLIRYAKDHTHEKAATQEFLDSGRGNPNWVATTPREAFLLLGQFALAECKRVREAPGFGGIPELDGITDRFVQFLARAPDGAGSSLLRHALDYAVGELGFDADPLVHELVDATVGDNYPMPGRMLAHCEAIVRRYLTKVMCDERPAQGKLELFATEGGTAAMCYVWRSLIVNRVLKRGDAIALGTPIFKPYTELTRLDELGLEVVEIRQSQTGNGHASWQYAPDEIDKLADPRIKAFLLANPSNPTSFAMRADAQRRIVELVRTRRPDLILLSDDVYGTFVEGFRSLAADLPQNTILFYSFSKHFGCTGWRLGVIAVHETNVIDQKLALLPAEDRQALRRRYGAITTKPDRLRFIDRLVADSREVALNYSAGLSTPQQLMMALFALFALLDRGDEYQQRCRATLHERLARLAAGLGLEIPDDGLRVAYYVDIDLEVWGRKAIGDAFVEYVAHHNTPIDVVLELARRYGTVLLNGSGFDGPPWSVRISLASLDAADYEAIGRDLKSITERAVARWHEARAQRS